MRKIRDVLRLRYEGGLSQRAIGRSIGLSQGAVFAYLERARRAGLAWPLPDDLDDDRLEALLFLPPPDIPATERSQPDWAEIHGELRKPGVTLALLWEEYRAGHPQGYGYSWFCERYRGWAGRLQPTMRQVHIAGEKLFVDFAGQTVEVFDPATGEIREAQIFVAVLGASNYTYAEARWTQTLPDWINAHVHTFNYLGGAARQTISDNLRAGITKACFFEPMVNRTYGDLARHYGTAILPARPRKARDKAKVEVGVQVVERWILARLRKQRFFSLAELNAAIRELRDELNTRPMRGFGMSRRELFEQIERPVLLSLPETPYEYAEWRRCRVGLDYHVEIQRHYYSVPFHLLRQEVEARITAHTVEIFHRGKRVASHPKGVARHRATTVAEHMPSSHRRYRDWTRERIQREAAAIGINSATFVEVLLHSRPHPEQGFRSCVGVLSLVKRYGPDRVEAACERALLIQARSYSSVVSILKNNLDRRPPTSDPDQPPLFHANIRGSGYYH